MSILHRVILILLLTIGTTVNVQAQEGERILSFNSEITIHKDASMSVRETIRVVAEGNQIKRGIFRDFPTQYSDRFGNRIHVAFRVESVLRDGQPETFRVESLSNGKRVRIGKGSVFLPPGEHVYTLAYRTTRQLGFFEEHDELYWNVTGTGWEFPIDLATATVDLPESVDAVSIRAEGYTGPQGSTETNYVASIEPNNPTIRFETTRPLERRHGLTIVAGWPKGHVAPPSWPRRLLDHLLDNSAVGRIFMGLILVSSYFLIAWYLIGRDPSKGTIIPRFHPPKGLSPAACRFVHKMGFDNTCFAAALISLAVKGVLKISKHKNGMVSFSKEHPEGVEVSPGEAALYREMMPDEEYVALVPSNHEIIASGKASLEKNLQEEFKEHCFKSNQSWFYVGFLMTIGFIVYGLFALFQENQNSVGPIFFVGIFTTVISSFLYRGYRKLLTISGRHVIPRSHSVLAIAVTVILVLVLFFVFAASLAPALFSRFTAGPSVGFLLISSALATVCYAFYALLKQPTLHGRKTMDEIDGFRMYLETAEADRLEELHPPEKTPELFERFLPYALALGVEHQWADNFADLLNAATNNPDQASGYHPVWYSSDGYHAGAFTTASLVSDVGSSVESSIASASTPPGSSGGGGSFSGGGGGGFSGGGGGGGGGGGW